MNASDWKTLKGEMSKNQNLRGFIAHKTSGNAHKECRTAER